MDRPEFHRLAEHELNEAAQYYDGEEPGLGSSFLQEVDRCLQSIDAHPEAGVILRRFCSSSPPPPVSLRSSVQDQAERHPNPRSDESQAPPYLLGGPRVTPLRQPNFCFQPADALGYFGYKPSTYSR